MKEAAKGVAAELRARLSTIRHPETGEFPTVVVLGDSLEDMSFKVEGSEALLTLVKEQLSSEDLEAVQLHATDGAPASRPHVFLSYGGEDEHLAQRIANMFMKQGIETWFAPWAITSGDSWRQEIEKGIDECTHFIALLTPTSIERPWVKTEIDAGFIKKVEARSKFVALRSGLPASALPSLLATLHSPSIDNFNSAIEQLISDIHGISRKPPLGPAPSIEQAVPGYSLAATKVAEFFVRRTETALFGDPQATLETLAKETGLTQDDLNDALHGLRAYFRPIEFERVFPKPGLFSEFDGRFMDWDPKDDALKLAADLHNDGEFPTSMAEIAERYGWSARRLNATATYLLERDLIHDRGVVGCAPWSMPSIAVRQDELRRFVKSRT